MTNQVSLLNVAVEGYFLNPEHVEKLEIAQSQAPWDETEKLREDE